MLHIIATRLGIGIARPTFFSYHIQLLRAGLHRSMLAQTEKAFEWLVLTDSRIDDANYADLVALVSEVGGRALKFDPITKGRMVPDVQELLDDRRDERILISRVDDDDVIAADFVEVLQGAAGRLPKTPGSLALADGIELFPEQQAYRRSFHPTTPVGISILSSADKPMNVFTGRSHIRMHEYVESLGGCSRAWRTDKPQWVYVRRSTSDSHEHSANALPKGALKIDAVAERTCLSCGLPADWGTRILELQQSECDPRPPITAGSIKRMQIKGEMLRLACELRKRGQEGTPRFEAVVNAFYAF